MKILVEFVELASYHSKISKKYIFLLVCVRAHLLVELVELKYNLRIHSKRHCLDFSELCSEMLVELVELVSDHYKI